MKEQEKERESKKACQAMRERGNDRAIEETKVRDSEQTRKQERKGARKGTRELSNVRVKGRAKL